MTTYAWPSGSVFVPQSFTWGAVETVSMSESPYTGAIVTGEVPFAYRYKVALAFAPAADPSVQMARIGFVSKIRKSHRIQIPHFGFVRNGFAPFGTLRGTPVLASSHAQGATTLAVTTSVAGQSVRAGDLLVVTTTAGAQVVTVTGDATAAGTALSATFEPPLRAAASAGASVGWNKPTPLFVLISPEWSATFRPGVAEPITLEFVEVW